MDQRFYPISKRFFDAEIKPLILACYSAAGRPTRISDYKVFNAILYVLRTGVPWRDF